MPKGADPSTMPQGFILSEAAIYSFLDQEVFPDIISFCAAIPDHLKPLFLIPIRLEPGTPQVASRVASRVADGVVPDGQSPEADLFGTRTFVYDDNEPTIPSSEPGSIFQVDDADDMTHHQDLEENQDENVQVPSDTSFMTDVDLTDSDISYPYRTDERPIRHSTTIVVAPFRLAVKPNELENKAPAKVKENAKTCLVSMVSYDKRGRVFTFDVNCGNGPKTVRAALSDVDHVAMNCSCPFWRYNGPEYHASQQDYMLGLPRGTAAPPDIRDPDRKYYLCKHAYAVLKRLDSFVADVTDQNWDLDEDELVDAVDKNWDKMAAVAEVPIDEFDEDPDVEWEEPGEEVQDAETDDLSDLGDEDGEVEPEAWGEKDELVPEGAEPPEEDEDEDLAEEEDEPEAEQPEPESEEPEEVELPPEPRPGKPPEDEEPEDDEEE